VGNAVRGFGLFLALGVALAGGAARPAATEPERSSAAREGAELRPGELLVELRQPERARLLARRVGATIDGPGFQRVQRLRVPPGEELARAAALRLDPDVRAAAPNYLRRAQAVPDDPFYASQWALSRIRMPSAWDVTAGDGSIAIAILDSGADVDHPDLAAKLLPGANTLAADPSAPSGHPDCTPSGDVRDDYPLGHGTHVAGIAGAATNNSVGVAGVAWGPRLIPVKVLDCTGMGSDVQVIAGIDWAISRGARVINLSVGGPGQSDVLDAAVERAHRAGVLVIAASGNAGGDVPYYPAASPHVLAVGATDQSDRLSSFSNFGDHIGVVAPGESILSTFPGGTYQYKGGTSMASPHVAGLAGLILSLHPEWPPDRVADLIRATADKVTPCPFGVAACPYDAGGRNRWYGFGRINAAAALCQAFTWAGATPTPAAVPGASGHRTVLPIVARGRLCL
jgi:subtilisin family serine protease